LLDISRYYVSLSAQCQNDETGKEKAITAYFSFKNKELFEQHSDQMFDDILELFNKWLDENGYENWRLDDTVDTNETDMNPEDCINPILVDK